MSRSTHDWICDKCNAYMNNQPGFNTRKGTWRCKRCGALNDVSEKNVLDLDTMYKKGIRTFKTKPLNDPEDDDF